MRSDKWASEMQPRKAQHAHFQREPPGSFGTPYACPGSAVEEKAGAWATPVKGALGFRSEVVSEGYARKWTAGT